MIRRSTRARTIRTLAVVAAAFGLLSGVVTPALFAAGKPAAGNKGGVPPAGGPKASIGQAMKQGFKGDNSPLKRILGGKGTKADAAALTAAIGAMAAGKPDKGDADDWKQRTDALVKAMDQINKGDKAGVDALQNASNCKACHNLHKGE